jgi:hypothetical protein
VHGPNLLQIVSTINGPGPLGRAQPRGKIHSIFSFVDTIA